MAVPSINSHAKVNPADIPLEKLSTSKALSEQQKTSEMTRQFEAMLLRQILTDAQKPAFKSKYASTGVATAIYQDQMTTQLADKISSARTLGLGKELESQVSRQNGPTISKASAATIAARSRGNAHAKAAAAGHAHTHGTHNSQTHPKHDSPPIPLTKAPRL